MSKASYVRGEVAKGQTRAHHCHARDCKRQVPPAYFMCAKHWRMVPVPLQRLVWKHYQPGQEKGEAGVSAEYLQVTREAIEAVVKAEGKAADIVPTATDPEPRRLAIDDLTPHDRDEVERFSRYLETVATRGDTPTSRSVAYDEVYGARGDKL